MKLLTRLAVFQIIPAVFTLSAALSAPINAHASGTDVGRGGDSIALDFKSVAAYDLGVIEKNANVFRGLIDTSLLRQKIATTPVSVQDRVFLSDVEKDALNFSSPERIVVGSNRWRELSLNDPRKSALVLHEYVSLMGVDDSAYAVSSQLLNIMKGQPSAFAPLYTCTLIKDPKRMPEYLQTIRVGGKGQTDIGRLTAETMDVQIYVGDGGSGTDVLITMNDLDTQVGMLELPHVRDYPPTIDLYAADLNHVLWQVHCSN